MTVAKDASETETSIELNLVVLKIKHIIKRENGNDGVHEPEAVYLTFKNNVSGSYREENQ